MQSKFPRELTTPERDLLFSVLPENKPGYNEYRNKISNLVVTGHGRFGSTNFILGKAGTIPDNSLPSAPVFALGKIIYRENNADIIIHEDIDNEIEFDISFESDPAELNEISRWNYSEWNPGESAPEDGSFVRQTDIIQGKIILAIAPVVKKIWIHIIETGVNLLIPVTNFYNYLMMVKNIRSKEKVFKPALLYTELADFSDNELVSAFTAYNKYFKRIKMDYSQPQPVQEVKKSKLNFFKRGRN